MSEFVREDVVHVVQISNGELLVSPSHDFIHRFKRIGAHILKYVMQTEDKQLVCNVPLNQEQAEWLAENCDLEILDREFMGTQEHEHWLDWSTGNVDDFKAMFDDPEDELPPMSG